MIYKTLDTLDAKAEAFPDWAIEKLIYTWEHNTILCLAIAMTLALVVVCILLIAENQRIMKRYFDEVEKKL
jgi:hypothetical protein